MKEETYWKYEEISRWKAHISIWKLNWIILMIMNVFLDQKRVNICKHKVKMAPRESFKKVMFKKFERGAVFTMCSHTFTLFWSRKTSVIVEKFQLSFLCLCVSFIQRSLNFFGKNFLFLFLFFVLSVLQYFPFHVDFSSFIICIIFLYKDE